MNLNCGITISLLCLISGAIGEGASNSTSTSASTITSTRGKDTKPTVKPIIKTTTTPVAVPKSSKNQPKTGKGKTNSKAANQKKKQSEKSFGRELDFDNLSADEEGEDGGLEAILGIGKDRRDKPTKSRHTDDHHARSSTKINPNIGELSGTDEEEYRRWKAGQGKCHKCTCECCHHGNDQKHDDNHECPSECQKCRFECLRSDKHCKKCPDYCKYIPNCVVDHCKKCPLKCQGCQEKCPKGKQHCHQCPKGCSELSKECHGCKALLNPEPCHIINGQKCNKDPSIYYCASEWHFARCVYGNWIVQACAPGTGCKDGRCV